MQEINIHGASDISGGGAILNFFIGKAVNWVWDQATAGNIDYASVAESQGTYYNTVGA